MSLPWATELQLGIAFISLDIALISFVPLGWTFEVEEKQKEWEQLLPCHMCFLSSPNISESVIFKVHLFISVTLGLSCCSLAFSGCGEQGLHFVAVHRPLIAGLLLRRAQALGAQAQSLWCVGFSLLWHTESSRTRD